MTDRLASLVYIFHSIVNTAIASVLLYDPCLVLEPFLGFSVRMNLFSQIIQDLMRFIGSSFFLFLGVLSFFLTTVPDRRSRNVFNLALFLSNGALSITWLYCTTWTQHAPWNTQAKWFGMLYFLLNQLLFAYLWFRGSHAGSASTHLRHRNHEQAGTTATTAHQQQQQETVTSRVPSRGFESVPSYGYESVPLHGFESVPSRVAPHGFENVASRGWQQEFYGQQTGYGHEQEQQTSYGQQHEQQASYGHQHEQQASYVQEQQPHQFLMVTTQQADNRDPAFPLSIASSGNHRQTTTTNLQQQPFSSSAGIGMRRTAFTGATRTKAD